MSKIIKITNLFNLWEFSQNNSFKVQTGRAGQGTMAGTAWTWYYKKTGNYSYDWYLMTNYHVVQQMIENSLKNYNQTNGTSELKKGSLNIIQLSKYSNNEYVPFLNSSDRSSPKPNIISYDDIKSINFISDNNNEILELFSDSSKNYNLDIAMIKISLDFSTRNDKNDLINNHKSPNVWEMYQKLSEEEKNKFDFLNLKNSDKQPHIYISGNPVSLKKLVQQYISYDKYQWDNQNSSWISDYIPADKFNIYPGSSGSAAYYLPNNNINLNNIVPIGIYNIYWPDSNDNVTGYSPGWCPFVYNSNTNKHWNIFDNFQNYLNKF